MRSWFGDFDIDCDRRDKEEKMRRLVFEVSRDFLRELQYHPISFWKWLLLSLGDGYIFRIRLMKKEKEKD